MILRKCSLSIRSSSASSSTLASAAASALDSCGCRRLRSPLRQASRSPSGSPLPPLSAGHGSRSSSRPCRSPLRMALAGGSLSPRGGGGSAGCASRETAHAADIPAPAAAANSHARSIGRFRGGAGAAALMPHQRRGRTDGRAGERQGRASAGAHTRRVSRHLASALGTRRRRCQVPAFSCRVRTGARGFSCRRSPASFRAVRAALSQDAALRVLIQPGFILQERTVPYGRQLPPALSPHWTDGLLQASPTAVPLAPPYLHVEMCSACFPRAAGKSLLLRGAPSGCRELPLCAWSSSSPPSPWRHSLKSNSPPVHSSKSNVKYFYCK